MSLRFCLTTDDKLLWAECHSELATGTERLGCSQTGLH
jgi:hypothetical protein